MKRKIAFISDHASPIASLGGTDSGGQNVYVAETAKELAKLGYEVDVFTRRDSADMPYIVDYVEGVRVIHIEAGPKHSIAKELLLEYMDDFLANLSGFIEMERIDYDLVHAHFWLSGLVAMKLKEMKGLPFVITFHALGYIRRLHQGDSDKFPVSRIDIEKEIVRKADYIIAECPQDRTDLLTHYQARASSIEIIPCGFNEDDFYPIDKVTAKSKIGIDDRCKIILQLGRIVPRKGIDNVIEAFAKIAATDNLLRLVIVGGDQNDEQTLLELNRLKTLAEDLQVGKQVVFTGSRQREELKYYYSAAEVFVSTPWYEPFGITPLESMACGTPVIGSAVGGIKYTVKDRHTGYLVQAKNPDALSERMMDLVNDSNLRKLMSKHALTHVNENFTWKAVRRSLADLYATVIDRKNNNYLSLLEGATKSYTDAIETYRKSAETLIPQLIAVTSLFVDVLRYGNKILVCGNGGSAAESQHFVAELVGRFEVPSRRALPVLSLNADTSVITAWANDYHYDEVFARQVEALGAPGDMLFCLSTSGNSPNILKALKKASSNKMVCVNLLGKDGGKATAYTDYNIIIPSADTARIQELHLHTIHVLCSGIEQVMFGKNRPTASQTTLSRNQKVA